MTSTSDTSTIPVTRRSRAANWLGFATFAALAAYTVYRSPGAGLALLPAIAGEVVVAIAFLTREPSRDAVRSPGAIAAAYAGTFLMFVFVPVAQIIDPELLMRTELPWMRQAGFVFWLAGAIMSFAGIASLRRSFSIEPAARRLVTHGAFLIARHPIYAGYLLSYIGMWFLYPTALLAAVVACWIAITRVRIHYEEKVLERAFPTEYARFRRRVGAFGPYPFPRSAGKRLAESGPTL